MLVAYYRVSTDRQGESGLGLEAQRESVTRWANGREIIREFVEVESGKRCDRPQLQSAIRLASKRNATLVVAKMDRLARNAAFLLTLLDSGLEFVACDNPHANRLTIGILAVVAEHEARCISERTKAALAAYKARGGLLGASRPDSGRIPPEAAQRGRERASRSRRERARRDYLEESAICARLRAEGATLDAIAERLNAGGFTTVQGKPFSKVQVHRILSRTGNDAT